MSKESLYTIDNNWILYDPLISEFDTRRLDAIPTDIDYALGEATFDGTSGKITYPIKRGVKSVRLKLALTTTTEDILKLSSTHNIVVSAGTITANGFSSPTIYVDGKATSIVITSNKEIVVTTATAFTADDIQLGYVSSYLDATVDLFGLNNTFLTASYISNLFENNTYHELLDYNTTFKGQLVPSVPFFSDLDTWHKGITDNDFAEKIAGLDAKILPAIAEVDGNSELQFTNLGGVAITSSDGTSTPSINGNNIEFTEGTCTNLLLDDGTFIPDVYSGYDTAGSNDATVVNITKDYLVDGSLHKKNIGYSLYENVAKDKWQVPFLLTGAAKISPTVPAGYTKTRDVIAGGSKHNLYDSLVDFAYFSVNDFTYKTKLEIDTSLLSEEVTNVPIRIYLEKNSFDFTKIKSGGGDIRFTDKDYNLLKYEIEYWIDTEGNEEAVCWVLLPKINDVDYDYFYMFYGNSNVTDAQTKQELWDNAGVIAVWHFADKEGSVVNDSLNSANGTVKNLVGEIESPLWKNDGGESSLEFNHGITEKDPINGQEYVDCGNPVHITEITGDLSISVRYKIKSYNDNSWDFDLLQTGLGKLGNIGLNFSITIAVLSDQRIYLMLGDGVETGRTDPLILTEWGVSDMPIDIWRTFIGELNGNAMKSYMEGDDSLSNPHDPPQQFDANSGAVRQKGENLAIGGWGNATTRPFIGLIDEIKIYSKVLVEYEKIIDALNYENTLLIGSGDISLPDDPSGLSLTLISGGVQIDFTDNTDGIAKHEIWGKSDSGEYLLVTILNAGIVTYDDIVNEVDLRSYKIRARIVYGVSDFIEDSIAMLGNELIDQALWNQAGLAYWDTKTNCVGDGNKIVISGGSGYLRKVNLWDAAKTYKIKTSWVRNSGSINNFYNLIANYVITVSGDYETNYSPSGSGVVTSEAYGAAFDGELLSVSIKEVLVP